MNRRLKSRNTLRIASSSSARCSRSSVASRFSRSFFTRPEALSAAEQTVRSLRAATDQRDLMHELLTPRPRVADPVYPSLHLPLVRAAFSAEFPVPTEAAPTTEPVHEDYSAADETTGGEAFPPRQLLDLTASEIARLRPAN